MTDAPRRIVITGANGAGKSHVARHLHERRPDLALISVDALKLMRNWQVRPADETRDALRAATESGGWIVEGGPGYLAPVVALADCVIWLDPPVWLRAFRLARRPLTSLGRTRPELPPGNPDHLLRQYRFAWASLRKDRAFRETLHNLLADLPADRVHHCRTRSQVQAAISACFALSPDQR